MKPSREIVIMMNGNFCCFRISPGSEKNWDESLSKGIVDSRADPFVILPCGNDHRIRANSIVGWYFRDHVEPEALKLQKELLDIVKNAGSEGDDWKQGD
jgi:hypothetical protein